MAFELPLRVFYFHVAVHSKYIQLDPEEEYLWKDTNPERFFRWHWYFKYRAALLQVRYPRGTVKLREGSRIPKNDEETNAIKLTRLNNKLRAKKGRITNVNRKLSEYIEDWNELFPYEDEEYYKKGMEKLFQLKRELEELKIEIKTLENV